MGFSGRIGAGGVAAIEDFIKRQLAEEQFAAMQQQQAIENQQTEERLYQGREEIAGRREDRALAGQERAARLRAAEAAAKQAEDEKLARTNMAELINHPTELSAFSMASGVDVPTHISRAAEQRVIDARLEKQENDPNTPPELKRLIGLQRAGVHGASADMVRTPEERTRRIAEDTRAREEAAAPFRDRGGSGGDGGDKLMASPDGKQQRWAKSTDEANALMEQGWTATTAAANRAATTAETTRQARSAAALSDIDLVTGLSEDINTGSGTGQLITGLLRTGKAAMNRDPILKMSIKVRNAAGRKLAVALMGAQNLSDADAEAWASLFPDQYTDQRTAQALNLFLRSQVEEAAKRDIKDIDTAGPPRALVDQVMAILKGAPTQPGRTGAPPAATRTPTQPAPAGGAGPTPTFEFNPATGKVEPVKPRG